MLSCPGRAMAEFFWLSPGVHIVTEGLMTPGAANDTCQLVLLGNKEQ